MKKKKCEKIGIEANIFQLDLSNNAISIITLINKFNNNNEVHGIMVQLPLPQHLVEHQRDILDTISPLKDVDGLTTQSLGKLISYGKINLDNSPFYISSTVYGVIKLIDYYNINLVGKDIAIVGNSSLVGMPLSVILSNMGATIDTCHIDTINLKSHLIDKDMVISCCGVKSLIKGDMVKKDVIIIDIGISVEMVDGKKKIFGDCEWESLKDKAKMITPVPGGVGPMTIASLLEQTFKSYIKQKNRNSYKEQNLLLN